MGQEKKLRATQHSGRMGIARHNDRHFPLAKADHIHSDKVKNNVYWTCYGEDISFEEAERRFYKENFQEWADYRNERAKAAGHPERVASPATIYESSQTQPEEVIYQIGDKDTAVSRCVTPEKLWDATMDFVAWQNENFGDHVKILDMAMHLDETTPHIHLRQVWTYQLPGGVMAAGQTKALAQMGFQPPKPDAKTGRNNNMKMTYTAQCRKKWLEILDRNCWLDVEHTPQKLPLNKQNLKKNDFIIDKQQQEIEDQQQELEELQQDRENVQIEIKNAAKNAVQVYGTPEIILKRAEDARRLYGTPEEIRGAAEQAKEKYGDPEKIKKQMQEYQEKLYGSDGLKAQMELLIQEKESLEEELDELIREADQWNAPEFVMIQADKVYQSVRDGICTSDAVIAKYSDGHMIKASEFYPEINGYRCPDRIWEDAYQGLCQIGFLRREPNIAPRSIVDELLAGFDQKIPMSSKLKAFVEQQKQLKKVSEHTKQIKNMRQRGRTR